MTNDLENNIKYKFKNKKLLEVAITHSSVQSSHYNNERLEFLGDRVLGLAISDLLYKKFNHEDEGSLAKRHTALVKREALSNVAEKINMESFIKVSSSEYKSGGTKKKTILSNAIEAVIGAIYLDSGYETAYEFIKEFWDDMLEAQEAPPEDAKSRLQEWAQGKSFKLPTYKVIGKSGSDHSPEFEIEVFVETLGSASAKAESKKRAEKLAAEKLLKKIEKKQ